jgi:hypothetical protein
VAVVRNGDVVEPILYLVFGRISNIPERPHQGSEADVIELLLADRRIGELVDASRHMGRDPERQVLVPHDVLFRRTYTTRPAKLAYGILAK